MSMRQFAGKPALRKHHLGPHPIIRHYLDRMNLRDIIRGSLGGGLHHSLDHAEVLAVLVHNILVSRGPMYRIKEWAEGIEPDSLGLTVAQVQCLNDDRIARTLEALASERGRNVFFRLALRVIKDFEIQVSRIHFDTTTVSFFGQYEASRSEPRITRGINKDHRPDLKQLLFGLNVSSDGAVPLLHHIFSGNRTDDSVHVRNTDLLRHLIGTDEFIYVADSKLCTQKNLEHIAAYGGKFVTIMPRTRKEDQDFRKLLRESDEPVIWWKLHEIPNRRRKDEPPNIYQTTTAGPQESTEGYRIIWIRSSQKIEFDRTGREERIRQAELELRELAAKVGTRTLRTRKAVNDRVRKILSGNKAAEFFETRIVTFTEIKYRHVRRGRPRPEDPMRKIETRKFRLEAVQNKEAIRREAHTDGVFPLITNSEKVGKREVLEIYKYQPYLEKRFELTKSEYCIAPIFLKKPARVVGLLHAYFVAIMLSALIEREARQAMKERGIKKIAILPEGRETTAPTTPRILEKFANATWYEFQEGGRNVSFPVELDADQSLLLKLTGVAAIAYQ